MSEARKAALQKLSIKDLLDLIRQAPELWLELRDAFVAFLDGIIAIAPEPLKPGLIAFRDQLATATEAPLDLLDKLFSALKDAVLAWDFGPATGDDSDTV